MTGMSDPRFDGSLDTPLRCPMCHVAQESSGPPNQHAPGCMYRIPSDPPAIVPPADRLRDLVCARIGVRPRELQCPREKSSMTPCVARDGVLAAADSIYGEVCVGCDRTVTRLLTDELRKQKEM